MGNDLVNRLFRMISRRLINRGIRMGADHVARGGRKTADMDPEERAQYRNSKQAQKRARQAMRVIRRIR